MTLAGSEGSAGVRVRTAATSVGPNAGRIQKRAIELFGALNLAGVMDQEKWIACVRQAREEIEGGDV